jgi:hypothetical protein
VDAVDEALVLWWRPLAGMLEPGAVFDAHTHIGRNDPDGRKQTVEELLAGLDPLGAGAAVFPMHEPDGYGPANDEVLAAAAAHPDRLFAYCRVDPRAGAITEARRCLDAGARGIKLHPRAERFTLHEPAIEELAALAHERRVPILIHAGRGIPALGRNAIDLASRYPDARLILAHAAVSDLAWLWREMPAHPNLLIDTSWWSPGDLIALFTLVSPGQIVWASDSPYGLPLTSAVTHLRYALQAGVGEAGLRSIAGGQMRRVLAGDELEHHERPAGEAEPLPPPLERVVAHLTAAMGAALYEGNHLELASLALLACDVSSDDPDRALLTEIERMLARSAELAQSDPGDQRLTASVRMIFAALSIARTPRAPMPA